MIYIAITSYFLPIEIIIYLFPVETIRHELVFLVIHVLDTSLVILTFDAFATSFSSNNIQFSFSFPKLQKIWHFIKFDSH